ncbi:MAG: hypothetical protein Q7T26_02235 [Dehalococcoidia bacterium]|nr:hypothetical protein [Dehalococcoidia bacterium]
MSKQLAILALLLGTAIAVSACTAAPAPAPQPPAPAAQAPAPAAQPPAPAPAKPAEVASTTSPTDATSIMVSKDPTLVSIMTDGKGRALYLFTKDERNKSNCVDACAQNWPPLTVKGDVKAGAGAGAMPGLIGTTARADGSTQVTYNGWPLYYFAKDEKPGDVKGQNVGAVWFALSMDGAPVQNAAPVKTAKNATLGTVLAEASGRTLYIYTKDERNKSNCAGACAQNWPPLLTSGDPKAGEGLTAGLIGTTARADGSTQVTYNGWPLYYFARDEKPGDVKGQNVGAVWFVANTDGAFVQNTAPVNIAKNATLGAVLADASGRTLYLFAKDEKNKSTCTGGCAQTWPPLLSKDAPKAGEGVTAAMLGTITRADGFTQVTYNGLPLYYFARDEKPGDVKGQNVGGNWFVVNPAGEAIKPAAAAAPSAPATAPMSAPASSSNSSY